MATPPTAPPLQERHTATKIGSVKAFSNELAARLTYYQNTYAAVGAGIAEGKLAIEQYAVLMCKGMNDKHQFFHYYRIAKLRSANKGKDPVWIVPAAQGEAALNIPHEFIVAWAFYPTHQERLQILRPPEHAWLLET